MKLQNFYDKKSFMLICLMMSAQNLMGMQGDDSIALIEKAAQNSPAPIVAVGSNSLPVVQERKPIKLEEIHLSAVFGTLAVFAKVEKNFLTQYCRQLGGASLLLFGDSVVKDVAEGIYYRLQSSQSTPIQDDFKADDAAYKNALAAWDRQRENQKIFGRVMRCVWRLGSGYAFYRMHQEPFDKVLSYANATVGKPLWGVASKVLAGSINHGYLAGTAGSHYMAKAMDNVFSNPAIQQALGANIAFGSLATAISTENPTTRKIAVSTGALALRLGFELPGVAQSALAITAGTAAALAAGSYVTDAISKGAKTITLSDEEGNVFGSAVLQPTSFWVKYNTSRMQQIARYATIATGMGVFSYCNFGFVKSCYTSALGGLYSFGQNSQAFYNAIPQTAMNALKCSGVAVGAFAAGRMSKKPETITSGVFGLEVR